MDYVSEILKGYLAWEKLKQQVGYENLSWEERDNLRLENDNDARYYFREVGLEKAEALKADTVISFWTPYCRLLELEANWKSVKTVKGLEWLLKEIHATWNNDYTSKIKTVNEKIQGLAKVYHTKGNYMLLPERKMNTQRYKVAQDRIDLTLYECFDKGALAKFFETDDDLYAWIRREKLDGMFYDKELSKKKIKWLISEEHKPKWISEMNTHEVYEYLKNATLLIEDRNKEEINSVC